MPGIDFLIIGVQKGGTTSLFEYMRRHPQVHIPAEKDIGFFNNDRKFHRGPDWYLPTVTRDAPPGSVCGEASTYYVSGTPFGDLFENERHPPSPSLYEDQVMERIVPERIQGLLPDVRMVCVLRDPVARAFSHHRMMGLERAETRGFDEAIEQLLDPVELDRARFAPTRTNNYITMGEYGRQLGGFYDVFPREQLLPIFNSELADDPAGTVARVFEFIGVDEDYVPDNIETRYRTGAEKERLAGLNLYNWQASLAGLRPARAAWRALPHGMRRGIDKAFTVTSYRVAMWNAKRGVSGDDGMSAQTRERLQAHYRPDGEMLAELVGREVPWLDAWDRAGAEPVSVPANVGSS